MGREFVITIDRSGWTIEERGNDKSWSELENIAGVSSAIGIVAGKNGKIVVMYDPFCPSEEMIEEVKNTISWEMCEFAYDKQTFGGTFADALQYIKEHFDEYRNRD